MTEKKYTAILIDTSIYDGNGLRLEKGLLGKLTQFKDARTKFLIPDVIIGELKNHLEQKVKASRASLEKSLDDADDHLFYEGQELASAKALLLDSQGVEDSAERRLQGFIEVTGAITINSGDHLSVTELLGKYFGNEPPFAETGKKKNEFPDAITLMAVESWAKKNSEIVYAVAKDNDWKNYCEKSDLIDYYEDLGDALAYFNDFENKLYNLVARLEKDIHEDDSIDFKKEVGEFLDAGMTNMYPDQDADSPLVWEPDGCQLKFIDFNFIEDSFKVIYNKNKQTILEAMVEIEFSAEGQFSLYAYDSIDKDNVYLDSVTSEVTEFFETRILITLVGDYSEYDGESEGSFEVDDVELLDKIRRIHYGYIEPDFELDSDEE